MHASIDRRGSVGHPPLQVSGRKVRDIVAEESTPSPYMDEHSHLRAVIDSAVDGVIIIDECGLVEAANPAAEKLFGYSVAEIVGRNVSMLMPSPYREEHDGYLQNYARTGNRKIIGIGREVEGRRKNGVTFPLYLAVSEVRIGHRRIFTGFVHDLTDLRKSEAKGTQLGRILEESLNEIFIFDANSLKFLLANRGALTNIGYSTQEMYQLTPVDIKPDVSVEQFRHKLVPLQSGKATAIQFETVHRRKNGTTYHVHVQLQKTTWEEKEAFVATVLDITQLKRVQQELANLNVELEQRVERRTEQLRRAQEQLVRREKLATLGQLSGGVAHEIRNPLGVIRNSVYYLKMVSDQLDEECRECVSEIEREVATANRIVSELLDFTRESPTCDSKPFPLTTALHNAIRAASLPQSIRVEMVSSDTINTIFADQGQFERILINLIRNACQAMSGKGTITIASTSDERFATVGVNDTGVGIPADSLDNIFEPLYTTKAKGIGLGLAVSRRYAQLNGGSLTVESTKATGTTFYLSVPFSERS